MHFLNFLNFDWTFTEILPPKGKKKSTIFPQRVKKKSTIVQPCVDNGLAPTSHQAIILTNDGYFTDAHMRHSASMSLKALRQSFTCSGTNEIIFKDLGKNNNTPRSNFFRLFHWNKIVKVSFKYRLNLPVTNDHHCLLNWWHCLQLHVCVTRPRWFIIGTQHTKTINRVVHTFEMYYTSVPAYYSWVLW